MSTIDSVVSFFQKDWEGYTVQKIGFGKIHSSYKVTLGEAAFFLQQINTKVFHFPNRIVENHWNVAAHLAKKDYPFSIPSLLSANGYFWFKDAQGEAWKATVFIEDTLTYSELTSPEQAFEGASAFAKFQGALSDINEDKIKNTIPGFHAVQDRQRILKKAIADIKTPWNKEERKALALINDFAYFFKEAEAFLLSAERGIIHGDTKISNLLFDSTGRKVKAVVDWDTIMKDSLFWDFGDMVRTYVPNKSEDEKSYQDIAIRDQFLEGLCEGYLAKAKLPKATRNSFVRGALFVIYLQAVRFFTDYLKGNVYYETSFKNQNLFRTLNQLTLLKALDVKSSLLKKYLHS